jgi:hypothetical protein
MEGCLEHAGMTISRRTAALPDTNSPLFDLPLAEFPIPPSQQPAGGPATAPPELLRFGAATVSGAARVLACFSAISW